MRWEQPKTWLKRSRERGSSVHMRKKVDLSARAKSAAGACSDCLVLSELTRLGEPIETKVFVWRIKVARYSFSGPIPPKFEHKLCRHKQSFGKTATTVVLDKDDNML